MHRPRGCWLENQKTVDPGVDGNTVIKITLQVACGYVWRSVWLMTDAVGGIITYIGVLVSELLVAYQRTPLAFAARAILKAELFPFITAVKFT